MRAGCALVAVYAVKSLFLHLNEFESFPRLNEFQRCVFDALNNLTSIVTRRCSTRYLMREEHIISKTFSLFAGVQSKRFE